jgi:hypothetical protein
MLPKDHFNPDIDNEILEKRVDGFRLNGWNYLHWTKEVRISNFLCRIILSNFHKKILLK